MPSTSEAQLRCVFEYTVDRKLVFKTNYSFMQVRREHSAIILTFIKLPFVIKIFVLCIFEWRFYTGFTVYAIKIVQRAILH